ncbi:MAG: BatA domain-containing protein, partial [Pirellulales bacterium]|nr:BatA domain-containing protein [Pirellulales bacterium]
MPTFDFMTLLWWGLPFAAAPVIIHLINLLRHRVIRWPAMEFLLASQRKYRTRILLKQLLLLLLRILAIVGLALLFAQPRWDRNLGGVLGSNRTRHVVLLDDSYSMGEVFGIGESSDLPATTAMSRGRKMVERLLEELAATPGQQDFSLGRLSRLQQNFPGNLNNTGDTTTDEQLFDIYAKAITPQNLDSVRTDVQKIRTSSSTTEIAPGIRNIAPMFAGDDGSGVLWLITDLRSNDWRASEDIANLLKPLADTGIEIHIVDTATTESDTEFLQNLARSNLTVERVEMIGGTPVSNVLLPWEVTVRNYSSSPSGQVS